MAAPWVSSLFTGTNRIVGRALPSGPFPPSFAPPERAIAHATGSKASQIASASAASFFCRFTNGLT